MGDLPIRQPSATGDELDTTPQVLVMIRSLILGMVLLLLESRKSSDSIACGGECGNDRTTLLSDLNSEYRRNAVDIRT